MKVRCFVFKLVDHERKETRVIDVTVFDNKVSEWPHTEEEEEHIKWKVKHWLWEKNLKKHVKELVFSKHFSGGHKFGDYRICKKCTKKEFVKVNLNTEPSQPFLERVVKGVEVCKVTLERGNKPKNWQDVLNYPKVCEHYSYLLESKSTVEDVRLLQVGCNFALSEVHEEHAKSQKSVANKTETNLTTQTGGRERESERRRYRERDDERRRLY